MKPFNGMEAAPLRIVGADKREIVLRQGEIAVLLGPNGAGKTSLLEIAAGLREPGDLGVSYGDEPLWLERGRGRRSLNASALRRYAYASQAPEEQLFARTAQEELEAALKPYRLTAERHAERIACGLEAVGWDASWASRNPFRMSGGERRRLALACLFASPADWLLLDEPTAGLDAPGQRLVSRQLTKMKESGVGVLLVSHDSEWSLALADRVLLLSPDGDLRSCGRDELLRNPQWWEEAGMTVPDWLRTVNPLLEAGVPPELLWNPSALAAEWIRLEREPERRRRTSVASVSQASSIRTKFRPRTDRSGRSRSTPLAAFDPRSVWLSYVLLSFAIFSIRSWTGIAASAIAALAATALARIPVWRWRLPIAGFILFSAVVSLVAGWGGGRSFDPDAFLKSLHSLTRTLLVMLLGLGLATAITPLRLRRSLEQLLSFRGRLAGPMPKFILTVTLMLRFIPVLVGEWERFARLTVARSKETSRGPLAAARRVIHTTMPFMLSLFRLGDQIAAALESRGVGRRRYPTVPRVLRWRKRDLALSLISLAVSALLWRWGG